MMLVFREENNYCTTVRPKPCFGEQNVYDTTVVPAGMKKLTCRKPGEIGDGGKWNIFHYICFYCQISIPKSFPHKWSAPYTKQLPGVFSFFSLIVCGFKYNEIIYFDREEKYKNKYNIFLEL